MYVGRASGTLIPMEGSGYVSRGKGGGWGRLHMNDGCRGYGYGCGDF